MSPLFLVILVLILFGGGFGVWRGNSNGWGGWNGGGGIIGLILVIVLLMFLFNGGGFGYRGF